jgi:hypothetical protein
MFVVESMIFFLKIKMTFDPMSSLVICQIIDIVPLEMLSSIVVVGRNNITC